MKIYQISQGDAVTRQVVMKMVQSASVLNFAEFYKMSGNADYLRKNAGASGGKFRALNSNYPTNVVSPSFANPALKILGDKVEVDKAHERRGTDIASVRAAELLSFAGNLGKQFQNYFFNGYTEDNSDAFDGLKYLIPSSQQITASANGLSVDLGNTDAAKKKQQQFLELIDELIGSIDGGAQVIFMDVKTLSRLTSVARDQITTAADEFGAPLYFYNHIPVVTSGYDNSGNRVLPHDEVVGSSGAVCTSVYAVRFGERVDLTLPTNIGVEVSDLGLSGVHYVHAVEFDTALVLANSKAAARLEGVIIS